jgi:hypothetical protein
VQVNIALVVTREGMALGYEIFADIMAMRPVYKREFANMTFCLLYWQR